MLEPLRAKPAPASASVHLLHSILLRVRGVGTARNLLTAVGDPPRCQSPAVLLPWQRHRRYRAPTRSLRVYSASFGGGTAWEQPRDVHLNYIQLHVFPELQLTADARHALLLLISHVRPPPPPLTHGVYMLA